jgi:hypothetical protein
MSRTDRDARARARSRVAVLRKTRLDDDTDPSPIHGADAVSLVTRLTIESWSLAGLEIPAYRRAETPYRFVPSRLT